MAAEAAGDFVVIAEVVRAVGLRGEVKLYPLVNWHGPLLGTDFLCWESGEPVGIVTHRLAGNGVVVGFAGSENRDQAEALIGRQLGFRREHYLDPAFPRPASGLPFCYLGREVHLADGQRIGLVSEVRCYGSQLTLVLVRDGREVLIPAVEPILRSDPGLDGPLVVEPPEGLLDVAGD